MHAEFTDAEVRAFMNNNPETKGQSLKQVRKNNGGQLMLQRLRNVTLQANKKKRAASPKKEAPPKMKGGGMYKGKSHAYPTGGLVKDLQIMRKR